MLQKAAFFFLKIAYASRLMTLCGIAYTIISIPYFWANINSYLKKVGDS